ncbi:MAG: hypothetical protein ABIJ48_07625 [Actinomycetota bacterium]
MLDASLTTAAGKLSQAGSAATGAEAAGAGRETLSRRGGSMSPGDI